MIRRATVLQVALLFAACTRSASPGHPDAAPAPDAGPEPTTVSRSFRVMGTQVVFTAYTLHEAAAVEAFDAAYREMARLEQLLTVWLPDSDVSRINAAAGKRAVKVAPETLSVLTRAVELSVLTSGKFDVTFGALSGLWKFDHDQDDRIPRDKEVKARLPLIDYRRIQIDPEAKTVRLAKAGMRIHLGGIGKGFAVDRAVEILRARGLASFMVQAGGDLYVAGTKGDRAWRVGIRDPRGGPSRYFAAAEVTDATFSTSGDYERFFMQDGKRYHHVLDPADGRPARASRSVTVMAPDAMTADGLSTGIFILGPERGLALAEAVEGVGAVIVGPDNRVYVSSRLADHVTRFFEPTDAP